MRRRRHAGHGHGRGHTKIHIMYIKYVEYLADMAQWQSKNKSTLHKEQHTFLSYELILNTNTHTAVV